MPTGNGHFADAAIAPEWTFKAFGLSVACELRVQGAVAGGHGSGDADVRVVAASSDELRGEADAVCVLERHLPDGSLGMRVEHGAAFGYRVHAPGHGDFLITLDGTLVRCAPASGPEWRWQRPLFGQVLPLAATLQGFELLHASAVELEGRAVAFTGRSGAGKSSLAAHLAASGAPLVTDDVLSVECSPDGVLAHPGVPLANVAAEQFDILSPAARARLGTAVGRSEKVHIELACMPERSLPFGRLYFVERGADVDRVTFHPVEPPDPHELLAATFMPHVVTPARLMTQLHTCAEIAREVSMFRLLAPYGVPAAILSQAVERHGASAVA
jgi:hypothetical protein